MAPLIKIALITGLATAGVIVLYEISNLLLVYHYFTYQYYIVAIAVIALAAGIMLTNRYHKNKVEANSGGGKLEALTSKELRVLELISLGRSNKEIAALNYVELSTIKTHINNIYFKLGVKNRKDAARLYHSYPIVQKSTLSPPVII